MAQKSIKTKLLQGTLEKSRVKTFTPGEIGEPMFNLDAGEQRIYNRIREHLHLHKAGKQVDEIYLSIAARAIGHLLHNAEILSKDAADCPAHVCTDAGAVCSPESYGVEESCRQD